MAELEQKLNDPRYVYIRKHVVSSLKCKEDKVDKLLSGEDSAAALSGFLDGGDQSRLLIYDAGKGELAAVRGQPGSRRPSSPLWVGAALTSASTRHSATSRKLPRALIGRAASK